MRRGDTEVRDVQNVADIRVDPEGALERRNHWEKTSHSLLVGAILHILYAEADKTLSGVANFLSDPRRPIEFTLRAMMTTRHLGDRPHPVVASAARELLNKSENERSGVLSTAMSFLGLYRDPVVAKVTSRCDWRIGDLVQGERPATLYLVAPPSDISRTKPPASSRSTISSEKSHTDFSLHRRSSLEFDCVFAAISDQAIPFLNPSNDSSAQHALALSEPSAHGLQGRVRSARAPSPGRRLVRLRGAVW